MTSKSQENNQIQKWVWTGLAPGFVAFKSVVINSKSLVSGKMINNQFWTNYLIS